MSIEFSRNSKELSPKIDFTSLENPSPRIADTFLTAQRCPLPASDKSYLGDFYYMRAYLEEEYAEHDRESYDCHSFMLAVARREFNISTLPILQFETPRREDFTFEADWEQELLKQAKKSPEYADYHKILYKLTEDIYDNSEHVPFPKIKSSYDEHGNETPESGAQNRLLINKALQQVLEHIAKAPTSRIILISDGRGDDFYDVHSSVILGLQKGGEDILVLEKEQIGSRVEIRKLSEVIEEWCRHYSHLSDLELNICSKSINELLEV